MMSGGDGEDHRLPEDAWVEILLWLPVISLLRFKTVCNSWRSTIDSPDFIHRHATLDDKVETFLFQGYVAYGGSFNISPRFFLISGEEFEHLREPPRFRVVSHAHPVNMVGSCHGIICLHDREHRKVALWNPAIKQFRLLPKSLGVDVAFNQRVIDFVAFGFDVESRDYKVLQVTSIETYYGPRFKRWVGPLPCTRRIQVYNVSTDSWRFIDAADNLPTYFCTLPYGNNHGRYLNGKFITLGMNWLRKDGYNVDVIVSFDFSKEMFKIVQLPDEHKPPIQLAFLGEKIAYIVYMTETRTHDGVFGVWVLNETGEEEYSWSKLYNIGPLHEFPLSISRNGEFGFVRFRGPQQTARKDAGLQLCNFASLEIKDYQVGEGVGVYRADVYKRSLVSLRSSYYLS